MKIKNPDHPLVGTRGILVGELPKYSRYIACTAKAGMVGTIIDVISDSGTYCVQFDETIWPDTGSNDGGCAGRGIVSKCAYVRPSQFHIPKTKFLFTIPVAKITLYDRRLLLL